MTVKLTLSEHGDAVEQATWSSIEGFFPHYEEFWQIHIVPLRCNNSIHPRKGIDEDLEFLAMRHYSTYVNLSKAYEQILGRSQSKSAGDHFPDEIYASLHRSAELAIKVVQQFGRICEICLDDRPKVDISHIEALMSRIVAYRNLIHEELRAVRTDSEGEMQIPRPDKLEKYRKWTDVLYESRPEDFVDVNTQLLADFRALCSGLEMSWKIMCRVSARLIKSKRYLEKQSKGDSVSLAGATSLSASGILTVTLSRAVSNVASPTVLIAIVRPKSKS